MVTYPKSKEVRSLIKDFSPELQLIAELVLEARDSNYRGLQESLNENE